jgi:hypothetical protein
MPDARRWHDPGPGLGTGAPPRPRAVSGMGRAPSAQGPLGSGRWPLATDTRNVTGPPSADKPIDTRRVIRLPRATRLLATLLTAWLVCAAVAFVVVWFTPLNLEHGQLVSCTQYGRVTVGPCPVSTMNPNATPFSAGGYVCPDGMIGSCYDPKTRLPPPNWVIPALEQLGVQGPQGYEVSTPAERSDRPILVLRAAALGTVFWVAFLGVRAVLSRIRFTVG